MYVLSIGIESVGNPANCRIERLMYVLLASIVGSDMPPVIAGGICQMHFVGIEGLSCVHFDM